MDTGTSLLTVPQQFLSALLQATGAQKDQYGQACGGGVPFPGREARGHLWFFLEHKNSLILASVLLLPPVTGGGGPGMTGVGAGRLIQGGQMPVLVWEVTNRCRIS